MNEDEVRAQLDEEYDRIIAETLRQLQKSKPLTRAKIAEALMKANKAYWVARLAILDDTALVQTERVAAVLAVPYAHAAEKLAWQVQNVFAGYQSAFGLTQKDAKDLLEHVVYDRSIADNLRTMAESMTDSVEKTRILAEISAPAYRYRMQRAEQIAKNAQETLENIARGEIAADRKFLQTETEKAYNITLDEAKRLPPSEAVVITLDPAAVPAKAPAPINTMPRADEPIRDFTPTTDRGIMDSFALTNTKTVNEIIDHDWKGVNFSERIWDNTDELSREVKRVLLNGELTGASEAEMAAEIRDKFGSGMYQAARVVRTEHTYCTNQAELKGLADAGFDEYEFMPAGESNGACDTCDDLDGQRFKIADAVVGVNLPPMHPNCRCTIGAVMESDEDVQAEIDRLLDGRSIEDIERELDRQIAEMNALPENTNNAAEPTQPDNSSTLNSAEKSAAENSQKQLTFASNGGTIETGSDKVVELRQLGKLDTQPLEKEFGKLKTDEVIVTEERIVHIKDHHPQDYEFFEKYGALAIKDPDIIIKDTGSENTVFMVKKLESTNLNVITKLILENEKEHPDYKNSVMSFYRIRNSNLRKLENKHKVLYKKE